METCPRHALDGQVSAFPKGVNQYIISRKRIVIKQIPQVLNDIHKKIKMNFINKARSDCFN